MLLQSTLLMHKVDNTMKPKPDQLLTPNKMEIKLLKVFLLEPLDLLEVIMDKPMLQVDLNHKLPILMVNKLLTQSQ